MDTWDNDFLGFVEKAHISFRGRANGETSAPSMAMSMSATASAKVRPVRSSPGKATGDSSAVAVG